ncbi:MAG: hypothetical protein FWF82_03915 [Oscillospiraceae bacterium]|nr:hypothetical protein [Oscillospiraceae bacterium]
MKKLLIGTAAALTIFSASASANILNGIGNAAEDVAEGARDAVGGVAEGARDAVNGVVEGGESLVEGATGDNHAGVYNDNDNNIIDKEGNPIGDATPHTTATGVHGTDRVFGEIDENTTGTGTVAAVNNGNPNTGVAEFATVGLLAFGSLGAAASFSRKKR